MYLNVLLQKGTLVNLGRRDFEVVMDLFSLKVNAWFVVKTLCLLREVS
jgi:hypothetical protein